MDINILRSIVTVLSFVAFMAIVFRVYSRRNRDKLEEIGRAVLDDDAPPPNNPQSGGSL
ncbi:CcoQ/FixQ family Cbb3-type cytochrome c oxidase assembly chaperone [Chitinimonas sp. BJYL2]|uniref:cbb3-type cytochrome oxidase subunit 3 n=1 Tax=Chitinimonas sp. BJYL2 TaxID=2976696 RepID=UPI0022B3D7A6|nr:CcoQ/FixQ family Cbb3-type cytochrome c oxidase assembly chaperone [Chitinimonas sp. BJYL2]